jgi:hypothetical protein
MGFARKISRTLQFSARRSMQNFQSYNPKMSLAPSKATLSSAQRLQYLSVERHISLKGLNMIFDNDMEERGTSRLRDRRLGAILQGFSHVTPDHIKHALATQRLLREAKNELFRIGEIMLFQKIISPAQLAAALREQMVKAQDSRLDTIEKASHKRSKEEFAVRHVEFPIREPEPIKGSPRK